tara:strand:+ start:1160 stop:1462 length:303 start_codon:yes stop_codon:yes gene_type:complete
MQIDITGHHINITDALNSYTKSKFQKLKKYSEYVTNIHVILTVEKERMRAEAKLKIKHGNLFALDEQDNMYAAIDEIVEKLDRQLKKEKEKIINYRRIND